MLREVLHLPPWAMAPLTTRIKVVGKMDVSEHRRPQDGRATAELVDEAFLRRIQYKMFLRSPNPHEYKTIFARYAASKQLECAQETIEGFVQKHYVDGGKRYRRCQPRDIISHAIDIINFENLPNVLKGHFDLHLISRLVSGALSTSLLVALAGMIGFARRDV